jgi:hypothetical protein
MATSELACTYAALILHDDGLEITADNISTILKAANVTVEPYWPSLFAKLFAKKSIGDLITNVGAGECHALFCMHAFTISEFVGLYFGIWEPMLRFATTYCNGCDSRCVIAWPI